MTDQIFDPVAFRKQFPFFASDMKYPDEQLSGYFTMATDYIYSHEWGVMTATQGATALNLLTAHLAYTNQMILSNGGGTSGVITGATIDKVNVSLQAPPIKTAWQHWLATSPFGLQLWALLRILSRGGFVSGGLPERDAFRNVYGIQGSGRTRFRLR